MNILLLLEFHRVVKQTSWVCLDETAMSLVFGYSSSTGGRLRPLNRASA